MRLVTVYDLLPDHFIGGVFERANDVLVAHVGVLKTAECVEGLLVDIIRSRLAL